MKTYEVKGVLLAFVFLGSVQFLIGCANNSSNVSPSFINPEKYANYDCKQIISRLTQIKVRHDRVERIQDSNAIVDVAAVAGGVVTLWSPVLFLNGESNQAHLAILKGELVALESAAASKGCVISSIE